MYSIGTWEWVSKSSTSCFVPRFVLLQFPISKPGITFIFSAFIWSVWGITTCMISNETWSWAVGCCCNVSYNNSVTNKFWILRCHVCHSGTWALRILLRVCLSFLPLKCWDDLSSYIVRVISLSEIWSIVFWLTCEMGSCGFWKGPVFSHSLFKVCTQCWECLKWSCFYNDVKFVCWFLYFFYWFRVLFDSLFWFYFLCFLTRFE